MRPALNRPEQLRELLGVPYTEEQLAAITAPLEPGVIVAGAGSGKTTVMSARVVWLVATGQVAPEAVLGLTFTNKAAGELAGRVRQALVKAGVLGDATAHPAHSAGVRLDGSATEQVGEPTISTYHAFAGRLIGEHGLRIGLEPSVRLLADATRFQLAARVLRNATGPFPHLTKQLPALAADLVALDGELSEHLVEPDRLRAHDTGLAAEVEAMAKPHKPVLVAADTALARLELTDLVTEYRRAKREAEVIDFGDQVALAARLALTRPEVGAGIAARGVPVRPVARGRPPPRGRASPRVPLVRSGSPAPAARAPRPRCRRTPGVPRPAAPGRVGADRWRPGRPAGSAAAPRRVRR